MLLSGLIYGALRGRCKGKSLSDMVCELKGSDFRVVIDFDYILAFTIVCFLEIIRGGMVRKRRA